MLCSAFMPPAESTRRREFTAQALIMGLAALLLFWGLDEKYLWQDEAQTAVLAQRLLRFGKPVAYDGVNLLTLDMLSLDPNEVFRQRTAAPRPALDYYRSRRIFKTDTTWKWHPWGIFLPPALSFLSLGPTTLAARLPFVLAGLGTLLLLYRLARRWCGGRVAAAAAVLLVLNPYWILHARQCRYYALSSLFLTLTLWAYARWQWGGRTGAFLFVAAAWCWFQVDFGTVWPVLAVLFADAFLAGRRYRATLQVGGVLAAALSPFIYYYELWGRGSQGGGFLERFRENLFHTNEYVVPLVVLLIAAVLLLRRRRILDDPERRMIAIACAIVALMMLWVPAVSEYTYLRYVIVIAPAAVLLAAWGLEQILGRHAPRFAWLGVALLVFTPWLSLPLRGVAPPSNDEDLSPWYRIEWGYLYANLFAHRPDPNRMVVEWLRRNSAPSDEIVINYEDLPLMFYLPNPIRGGIAAFRVEDQPPPRFLILRRSADFVYWPAFERVQARYRWAPAPLNAPDVPWGNNPDPMGQDDSRIAPPLYIARRLDP